MDKDSKAQPSPAGQGAALAMIGDNLRSMRLLTEKITVTQDGSVHLANIKNEIQHALQLLEAALAVRQPVGVPARLPSHTVDGELSVASAIDQVLELFPSSGRAALQTLAGLFTHPTIYRYAAPPGQAVDLWQFRDAVMIHRMHALVRFKDTGDEGHKAVVDDCDRLLALIDSQA